MSRAEEKKRRMMYATALSYYGIKSMNRYSLPALNEDVLKERLLKERLKERGRRNANEFLCFRNKS